MSITLQTSVYVSENGLIFGETRRETYICLENFNWTPPPQVCLINTQQKLLQSKINKRTDP